MNRKENISKADMIRRVTNDDSSLPNCQIKTLVKNKYGVSVESNQITEVLGRYADRQFAGKLGKMQLQLAKDFVRKIGSLRHAVRLLHLSQTKGEV
jgi:hypothetical protein